MAESAGEYTSGVSPTLRRRTRRALRTLSRPAHGLLGSIMEVRTEKLQAALTFDDGPDEHHTMRILEVLATHQATATFFVLARRAAEMIDVLEAIRAGGNEVGLHGDDHSPLIGRSTWDKAAAIRRGKHRLEDALGERIRFFRPPYGWQDVRSFLAARAARLEVIWWSAVGEDWLDLSPAEVANRAAAGLEAGAIVLLHDRYEPLPGETYDAAPARLDRAEALRELLARAEGRGIDLVSLSTVLSHGVPLRRPWFSRPVKASQRGA